ncbi:hypothetical protein [Streptomyces sp. YIM B13518]|uniref:hypothetical protein n=1 Tax=Streptomyces sp. YIM B13518 TaxID=3366316 RepID=UPI0036BCB08F
MNDVPDSGSCVGKVILVGLGVIGIAPVLSPDHGSAVTQAGCTAVASAVALRHIRKEGVALGWP